MESKQNLKAVIESDPPEGSNETVSIKTEEEEEKIGYINWPFIA